MPDEGYRSIKPIPTITPRQAWQRMSEGGATLIDVRETYEYLPGHAEGALSIPLSVFGDRYLEIPSNTDILIICHIGERSLIAAAFMRSRGWEQVYNVEGGTDLWEAERLPMQYGN